MTGIKSTGRRGQRAELEARWAWVKQHETPVNRHDIRKFCKQDKIQYQTPTRKAMEALRAHPLSDVEPEDRRQLRNVLKRLRKERG